MISYRNAGKRPDDRPAKTRMFTDLHDRSGIVDRNNTWPVDPDQVIGMPGQETAFAPDHHPRPGI
jgi:hypothetical protein